MKLSDYISKNLDHIAMISLSVDTGEPFQYNYWNWIPEQNQLILLKDDFVIGHIIFAGDIIQNYDGSINHNSKYHPKTSRINFYFGGSN